MEKTLSSSFADIFNGQYRLLWPSPTGLNQDDVLDIKDAVLVKFISSEEMIDNAGYWVKFIPIAGDYRNIFGDTVTLSSGTYGKLGYAATSRLAQRGLTSQEQLLNEKYSS